MLSVYLSELSPKDCRSECGIFNPLKNNPLFSTKPICDDNFSSCKKPVPLLNKGLPFTNKRKLATLPLSSSV